MTLLVPNEAIFRRWDGALHARLRHAPIEVFLRSHDIKVPFGGPSLLTDHLVRATVYLAGQSSRVSAGRFGDCEQVLVGEMASGIGLKPAAFRAAAAAHAFWKKRRSRSVLPVLENIGVQASIAVRTNRTAELLLTARMIDECLAREDTP